MCPAASPCPNTLMLPDAPHPFSIPPDGAPHALRHPKSQQHAMCSTTGDSGPLSSALCQPQLCQMLHLARAALPANFSPQLSTQAARGLREAVQHRGEGWEMPSNSPHTTAKYKPVVGGGAGAGPSPSEATAQLLWDLLPGAAPAQGDCQRFGLQIPNPREDPMCHTYL